MTMSPALGSLAFRARRFPIWLCFGISAFLLLLGTISVFAARGNVGLVLLFLVIVGAPGMFVLKLANDLRCSKIVITDEGLDARVSRFRIWALRPLGAARLPWPDVYAQRLLTMVVTANRLADVDVQRKRAAYR